MLNSSLHLSNLQALSLFMSEDVLNWKRPETQKELQKLQNKYNGVNLQRQVLIAIVLIISVALLKPWLTNVLYLICLIGIVLLNVLFLFVMIVRFQRLNKKDAVKYQTLTNSNYKIYYRMLLWSARDKIVREYYRHWMKSPTGLLMGDYQATEGYLKGFKLKNRIYKETFNQ
jgi:hypothetical protein